MSIDVRPGVIVIIELIQRPSQEEDHNKTVIQLRSLHAALTSLRSRRFRKHDGAPHGVIGPSGGVWSVDALALAVAGSELAILHQILLSTRLPPIKLLVTLPDSRWTTNTTTTNAGERTANHWSFIDAIYRQTPHG